MINKLFQFVDKNIGKIILVMAILLSVASLIYYYSSGLTLAYSDAKSHLNDSRRIIDNLTPGFGQVGSVWLPLLHLLMLPFIWNDFLWHTGFAGSIVSSLSFILSSYFIYKTSIILLGDKRFSILTSVFFMTNPNILYMQTTAMTESLLLFFLILSTYFLAKWAYLEELSSLIGAALFIFFASLIRYDGWFMAFFGLLSVVGISLSKRFSFKKIEGPMILFSSLAFLGIILWFIYNWVIFNNPFYFFNGPYSAYLQQAKFESNDLLPTKFNIIRSLIYYLWAMKDNIGILYSICWIFGLGIFILGKNKLYKKFSILILLSPFIFYTLALFFGHATIQTPALPPHYEYFNNRYGLMMLPAASLFLGYLFFKIFKNFKIALLISVIFISIQLTLLYSTTIITVKDATVGEGKLYSTELGNWLKNNYKGGLILASFASSNPIVFDSGIHLDNYIYEGNGKLWLAALQYPSKHVSMILVNDKEKVWEKLLSNPDFYNNFTKIYTNGDFSVYENSIHMIYY